MLSLRCLHSAAILRISSHLKPFLNSHKPFSSSRNGDDEWNDAWESAWLPEDMQGKNRAPWETDVNFSEPCVVLPTDIDTDTKAFVQEMDENWNQRRGTNKNLDANFIKHPVDGGEAIEMTDVERLKRDYRLKKQRIHASLWMKETEKEEEARLGNMGGNGNDIEKLLDSCSEFFHSANELSDSKCPSTSEFKTKPDGWETTMKVQDGNIWEMSQREEDILVQEFERRIAFSKFQIASFIKSHIFSRRRPIDGWKYMIEEIGPNSKKGKGSVPRLPAVSDPSTQPFAEEQQSSRLGGRLKRGR
ncbi:protein GAMETE CELL DEFECTIVE 1, mitochondrial [Aristolochia californica]|uniref:protein GAMETE CELL DEFECTIVE 1, mitochondrial n=1 Tax=Aristolochia californica TaxID=171875 RepID=UPI0035E2159C